MIADDDDYMLSEYNKKNYSFMVDVCLRRTIGIIMYENIFSFIHFVSY